MAPIATYVYFDLGTTRLGNPRYPQPEIREIHMLAFNREELRRYFKEGGEEYCADPPACEELHCRLDEDNVMWSISDEDSEECSLNYETAFFLDNLQKPVCLIAHNGNTYDFPLLKAELEQLAGYSFEGIVCADSMAAFYDIMEPNAMKTSYKQRKRGSLPWPDNHFEKRSYGLRAVYERVCGFKPKLENAKDRNKALVNIALGKAFEFMLWVAENNYPLSSVILG